MKTKQAKPFAPFPLQKLHCYYGLVRHRYLILSFLYVCLVQNDSDFSCSIQNPALHAENYTYQSFKDITDEIKSLLVHDIENTQVIFHEDYSAAPFIRYPKKHIRSILHNLITNAIKYRSPLRKPEITIKTTNAEGFTIVEVSDNGIAIKEEDKNKVFSMYHRLEEGKNEEGTGVGLGLVAKIVDGSYGRIEIESKVNEGSTFSVYLK